MYPTNDERILKTKQRVIKRGGFSYGDIIKLKKGAVDGDGEAQYLYALYLNSTLSDGNNSMFYDKYDLLNMPVFLSMHYWNYQASLQGHPDAITNEKVLAGQKREPNYSEDINIYRNKILKNQRISFIITIIVAFLCGIGLCTEVFLKNPFAERSKVEAQIVLHNDEKNFEYFIDGVQYFLKCDYDEADRLNLEERVFINYAVNNPQNAEYRYYRRLALNIIGILICAGTVIVCLICLKNKKTNHERLITNTIQNNFYNEMKEDEYCSGYSMIERFFMSQENKVLYEKALKYYESPESSKNRIFIEQEIYIGYGVNEAYNEVSEYFQLLKVLAVYNLASNNDKKKANNRNKQSEIVS